MKVDNDRLVNLEKLESKIQYKFNNIENLDKAFYHISIINEQNGKNNESNERMEFLGDSILGLIFSEYIYKKYKNLNEGDLTKIKSKFVCEESFAYISRYFDLGEYLILGKGEDKSGGRKRDSILADVFEAVIAAIYLDSGSYTIVYELITKKFIIIFDEFLNRKSKLFNYKEILQNHIQINYKSEISYILDKTEGPDHEKIFYITAIYQNIKLEQGVGKSKKIAEQNAAKKSLRKLGVNYE